MKSQEYWQQREAEHMKQAIVDDKKLLTQIEARYKEAYHNIQKEIDAFYSNYAGKEQISISEAKKRAAKMDIEAFASKAKKYVKEKDFSPTANQELRLYNLTMRVNRLELLKANIGLELIDLFNGFDSFFDDKLTESAIAEMTRQAGILGETVWQSQRFISNIVHASYHNATFSEYLWADMEGLKSEIERLLVKGITQGKHPDMLARELSKSLLTQKGKENAVFVTKRLMLSELSRIQGDVQKSCYLKGGFKKYRYISELGACKRCGDLNNKVFEIADMQVGLNMYPMHNFCRCSTVPEA